MGIKKTIERIIRLEDFRATCKIHENDIRSLKAADAKLAEDFKVRGIIEKRELELLELQQKAEKDVHGLLQHTEEPQCLRAQVQETLWQEVVDRRDRLIKSTPQDRATAALNKAVAVEQEKQQTKDHEEICLLEETWNGGLGVERQRLQREQLQEQTDLERKYE
ncbi:hypothetical protein IscW_ISCW021684 [Ixodes scapularis]|uniref:Uncharacterized protein n=1 Tax=Ixodes scapularis TaxID=6945 RepID=B7Q6Z9_IXOSC|nr:hypothetical protein IscW_ISCW021684 [Ixodes scapularis]|eukprot:XP_002412062.1 hypothetical protein IscW_ISCW021684 [Ixodes scapularis]